MIALDHWTVQPAALALGAVLAFHEYGRRRLARRGGDGRAPRDSKRQALLFRTGAAWAVLTLVSPLGYWSHTLLFARAGLDLSFAFVVPPLVVLGAPWTAFAAGAGIATRRGPPERPAPGGPVAAIAAFLAVLVVWQVPVVLNASVRWPGLWAAQICCYLAVGVLLWLQLTGSYPFEPGWDPLRRLSLIAAGLGGAWLTGVALVIARQVRYAAFAGGPLSKSMDQGLAGAVMCVLPLFSLGIAAFWCFAHWLDRDEDECRLEEVLTADLKPKAGGR